MTEKNQPTNIAALNKIIDEHKNATNLPSIVLTPQKKPAGVFASKLGGAPYLPPGFQWPLNLADKQHEPLRFLAQLNFAELPKLPDFPQQGILQFYIAADDLFGLDFDHPTAQKTFRLIYHKDILSDQSQLGQPPEQIEDDESYFPFKGEFSLAANLEKNPMPPSDFRFDKNFMAIYKKHMPIEAKSLWDLDDDSGEHIDDELMSSGHRVGGYPFFTQEDPRSYGDTWKEHSVLLLQIDSDNCDGGNYDIIWGDCGVANFFIKPDDLKKLDFSNVLYNWDCY